MVRDFQETDPWSGLSAVTSVAITQFNPCLSDKDEFGWNSSQVCLLWSVLLGMQKKKELSGYLSLLSKSF